jgi:replicative DNA helicase
MNYYEEFNRIKEDGLKGLQAGIPFKLERFNNVVHGIQKSRLYLTGGASGSGKTKFTNEHYVFNVFEDWIKSDKSYPLHIHYFSLEMPRSQIVAALTIRWLYKEHNILTDVAYILGYYKGVKMDMYTQQLLSSIEFKEYIQDFESVVKIIDTKLNYVTFNNYVKDLAKSQGEIITKELRVSSGETYNVFKDYIEKDRRQVNIIIIDHIGLVKQIQKQTERQMMLEMADIMIKARNRFKFTFVVSQQLNRSFGSSERAKLEDVLPKDLDFRSGSAIFDAADVVLGIFSPNRERMTNFMGYRIQRTRSQLGMGNRFISINVVKNRYGMNNSVTPALFLGEVGLYAELPADAKDFEYETLLKYKKIY